MRPRHIFYGWHLVGGTTFHTLGSYTIPFLVLVTLQLLAASLNLLARRLELPFSVQWELSTARETGD